ncbi:MAG: response regulator transcription factor [Gemmatimonadota bacterium]
MIRGTEAILDPLQLDPDQDRSKISVLLVDDERLFAEALGSVLRENGIDVGRVVSPATEPGPQLVEAVRQEAPDVVILGVDAPTPGEIQRAQTILDGCPTASLLFLAASVDRAQADRVHRSGSHGCLSKDVSVSHVVRTVRTLAGGSTFPGPKLRYSGTGSRRRRDEAPGWTDLTPRERQVLELIASGARGRAIANRLGISENTVRTHSQSILVKLKVHSRLEAAALAIRSGLVRPGSYAPQPDD